MTVTVASLVGEMAGVVGDFVPDFAIYLAAGFILSLTIMGVRRFRSALR